MVRPRKLPRIESPTSKAPTMTAVAVATPNATEPETRHEYLMLARIKCDIVKGVILLAPCKSAISVSLQQ